MTRKLILASAITLVLAGTDVAALGLGGLRTQSALNQPFYAEIDLRDVKPDELDSIKISMASGEAFSRAGIERYYYLTRLRFSPDVSPQGAPIIRVSSQEPIREPYMDFLVEVVWPTGRLVKGYTVLLDPPTQGARMAPNVQAPRAGSAAAGSVSGLAGASAATAAGSYIPAPGEGFPVYVGPVGNGTGLWALARNHAPPGATAAQTAMALYRNNQNAFIRGGINRLVAGKTLVIPSRAELFALDAAEAEREYVAALRGRAAYRAPITNIPPEALSRLRIAGAAPAGAAAPAAVPLPAQASPPPGSPAAQQDLLLALETSESARQETVELRDRIRELETQLADIQSLLQLRNAELAQTQLGEPALAPEPVDKPPVGDDRTETPAELAVESPEKPATDIPLTPDVDDSAAPGAPDEAGAVATLEAALAEDAAESAPALVPVPTPAPIDATSETAGPAATTPVDAARPQVATPEPRPEPSPEATSTWHSLLLPLAGLAGVTALGIMAFSWIAARRRRDEEEAFDDGVEPDAIFEPLDATTEPRTSTVTEQREPAAAAKIESPPPFSEVVSSQTKDAGFESGMTSMSSLSDFDAETDEADVLSEADIYIAYGRHSEARDLLKNELRRFPERLDVKYKLAESFGAAKDADSLREVLDEIRSSGGDTQDPAQWQRMRTLLERIESAAATTAATGAAAVGLSLGKREEEVRQEDLGLDLGDSLSLDISDVQRLSERGSGRPDDSGGIEFEEDAPLRISDSALDEPEADVRGRPGADQDSFGDALTVAADRDSELELTLEEHRVEDVDDLDSIFDSTLPDQPTLARDEVAGERPSGPGLSAVSVTDRFDASESGLSPEQESVPTDLLSSQWQIDSGIWDETATKLDLARAYIEMEDKEAAREILEEVISEGRDEQRGEAQAMLAKLI
ncbi:FimV/HubP family polar landmark protein [Thiocystis violacea]|uniref:FimV/HubP family polar landmark protein n=1 Tax=Thiocystis violacea TaxID=13725 RepID=UPI001902FB12|nr:FimV/HubP family polar landmark protein [Thiocystis violacea]